jgi:hypothetical protein
VSKRSQAKYIAESILQHAAQGWKREVHEYTGDKETQQLVLAVLAA